MRPNALVVVATVLLAVSTPATVVVADHASQSAGGEPQPARTVQAAPDVEVEPETLRFSTEARTETGGYASADADGNASTRTLTVRNVGDAPLNVTSIVVVGPDREAFELSVDGPVTIEPGGSRDVVVSLVADAGADAGSRPRFATLHVMSDDPDEPQVNVWLTTTETVADVSPSRVLATRTLVNATVRDAEANVTQSLNLSWPLTRDDVVAIDALSFTPERDGDLRLSVATNASRFGDVPPFDLADGTEPAGFVRVDHTIANEDVRNVTLRVRVRRDLLDGPETGPEDVALYRHEAGRWTELPTRLVDTGPTHLFFEARSPGLSDFATGVKQATFRITDAVVTVTRIRTHEGTDVLVRVRNVGGADGTYEVKLLLEDAVVDRRELSIAPNGTRQATFERSFDEPGTYRVAVNERFVGTVTVEPVATATATASTDPSGTSADDGSGDDGPTPTGDGGPSGGVSIPGPGPVVATLALLVAALLAVARTRR